MNGALLEEKLGLRYHETGRVRTESVDQILDRVAGGLGEVERLHGGGDATVRHWTARFRDMMADNRFWPSGRVLNGCGASQPQLASCFVLQLADDFEAIFDTLKLAASCHRMGGGTGFDFSPLRERGARIGSAEAAGASGAVSWLRLFDAETGAVMQGGRMRGANLASLSVRHPDIMEFIDAKRVVGRLSNFNLSVAIDDTFMRSLAADEEIELVSPVSGDVVRTVRAAEIWERIAENAWHTGDPGLLFPDTINRANPLAGYLGPIRTTNPCGEQTLYPFEASNLGSVNLASFLRPGGSVDLARLEETVADAVRLLDNAIDACRYPDPRITAMALSNRRLGLGVMGFADLLVGLGIRYDSTAALALVDEIGAVIRDAAWACGRRLAAERAPFPNFAHTGWTTPARNCAITTIAPTGTISMVAECSSGIEPRFAAIWTKDVLYPDGVDHVDADLVADVRRQHGLDREEAIRRIGAGPVDGLALPAEVATKYRYAHDVSGEWHVQIMARWQRYVDNAVSKTVNLRRSCSMTEVSTVYQHAWQQGCKGVSLYREGSRDRDLLEVRHGPSGSEDETRQSKRLLAATLGAA